jgi:hypothetical protein
MKKLMRPLAIVFFISFGTEAFPRNATNLELKLMLPKVSEHFKDPDSVKITNVKLDSKQESICGMVNAKNSYGGYSGAVPFNAQPIMKGSSIADIKEINITSEELNLAKAKYQVAVGGPAPITIGDRCNVIFPGGGY